MPKLLQINVTCNWGSTGKIAELIGQEAIKQGWESFIAYGRHENESASKKIKIGSKRSIYIHYLSQRLFDNEGLCSKKATRQLIDSIKIIRPDVIHLHNIHDHFLNYILLFEYLNQTDIKIVWTMHDFWAITGHCMHFISAGCIKYKTECKDCPMRTVYPKSLFDRSKKNYELKKNLFTANRNIHLVAVSDWVGKALGDSFLKNKPTAVINNGIDLGVFKPTENKRIEEKFKGKFMILSVASQWKHDKGLNDYKMMAEMLSDDEIIVLVGVDDDINRTLPKNIIGIKHTDNLQELSGLYTRANVVTILSSAETFGLTVVEGYACGTPAVVYDNTAPPALITPETGFVVENHNPTAAYKAIQEIKKRGKDNYYRQCLSIATKIYDKHKCAKSYIDLYNTLLYGKPYI